VFVIFGRVLQLLPWRNSPTTTLRKKQVWGNYQNSKFAFCKKKKNPLKIMFWYEIHNFVLVCSRKSGNEANM
jgi:hypothetical protein